MKYDFDKIIDRKINNSEQWGFLTEYFGSEKVLPFWVADMDFEVAKPIKDILVKRAKNGVFGYGRRSDCFFESIVNWMRKRHNWNILREWIVGTNGIVPSLNFIIQSLTEIGDSILIQPPVYHPFSNSIKLNNRNILYNDLLFDGQKYSIDFEDLELQFSQGVKMMFLCNPHNPTGSVWSRQDLETIGKLCCKYDVLIISDEIHQDIVYLGHNHIPIASISEEIRRRTITCCAPSKTFNIAGLVTSYLIIPDDILRETIQNHLKQLGFSTWNIFGNFALPVAYNQGAEWLEQLLQYLEENIEFINNFLREKIPEIKLVKPQGTYIGWLDCRNLKMTDSELEKFFTEYAKVGLLTGRKFGINGSGFMRIVFACPKSKIEEGLTRILNSYDKFNKSKL